MCGGYNCIFLLFLRSLHDNKAAPNLDVEFKNGNTEVIYTLHS